MSDAAGKRVSRRDPREGRVTKVPETSGFVFNQTMLRIREPGRSLDFYIDVLGMSLLKQLDFPEMRFTLYFLGYLSPDAGTMPEDARKRTAFTFRQPALLELTHNWGTEADDAFAGYHNGNDEPKGFGHIGLSVPNVEAACRRFESLGVGFVKRPDEGKMKGLAFVRDPDGYWIEILEATSLAKLAADMGEI